MEKLIKEAIELYKQEIIEDQENTDAIFFIIEDLGSDMSETEFEEFNNKVMESIKSL